MITDNMKTKLIEHLRDSLISSAGIGMGGNSTNPSSVVLDVELLDGSGNAIGNTLTKTASDLNVLEAKVAVSGTNIQGKVIREVGLKDSSGNLLARVNFDGVGPFASNETLEIFLLMEIE